MNLKTTLGMLIGLASMVLCWYWYGWKLVVIIMLAIWGNNLERNGRK